MNSLWITCKKAICWLEKGIATFSLFRIVLQELLMQQSPSNGAECRALGFTDSSRSLGFSIFHELLSCLQHWETSLDLVGKEITLDIFLL